MADFSILSATVRTAPKLGGWVPLPGLDIRTELKGVVSSFFGLNLAVFIFLFSAWTMWFWSILAEKTCFGQIWPRIVVLVTFCR